MSRGGLADTDPEIQKRQWEAMRRLSPLERLQLANQLNRTVADLAAAGIRDAHPRASDREVFLRLAVRRLGYDVARRMFPDIERIEGIRR